MAGKHMANAQADQQYQDASQDQRLGNLEQQQAQQAPVPAPRAATGPSMADQLNQLADLHNQGLLSEEEFAAAKAKLLGG
jgi:hypothetical protein